MKRHRPYLLWGLALLLVTALGVAVLTPPDTWVALDQRRSSLRTTPDGVAAWARALDSLGVTVAPRYASLVSEPPRGGGLVLLEPVRSPSAAEAHAVLEWVRAGGTLVYSPMFGGLLLDSLGIGMGFLGAEPMLGALPDETPLDHPWTEGARRGPGAANLSIWPDSARGVAWVPLTYARSDEQVTLAWVPVGEGGTLVLADAESVANGSLGRSTSALVVTRAVADRLGPADTLFFSEYHQAMDGRRGVLHEAYALTAATPWGRTVLYLGFAALALALLGARRFGRPLPEPPSARRSTLEHVRALARIYEAAGASGSVARHLVRGAGRRLGAVFPSGDHPEEQLLGRWRAHPDTAEAATAALAAYRASPPDLDALERALDRITFHHISEARHP